MARAPDERSSGGFTILELLVTLALFALLLLVVPSSLQFNRRIWAEEHDLQSEQARAALADRIRSAVARARPEFVRAATGEIAVQFDGGRDAIDFIAIAEQGEARGGPYRYRIDNTSDGSAAGLTFYQAAYPTSVWAREAALDTTALSRTLSSARIRFSYFGPAVGGRADVWQDMWRGRQTLPRLVAFEIEPRAGETFAPVRHAVALRLAQ